jgi:hypothetical protein
MACAAELQAWLHDDGGGQCRRWTASTSSA